MNERKISHGCDAGTELVGKQVGTRRFNGRVEITDPCYDKTVWCRTAATVQPGDYDCRVWVEKAKKADPKAHIYAIGIYLDGKIPAAEAMEQIDDIGVDAGMAGFFEDKPDYNDAEWDDFCNYCCHPENANAWMREEGFWSSSGYGDGRYDVYAYGEDGAYTALEIRFYEDWDDDDGFVDEPDDI